VVAFRKDSTIL